MAALKKSVAERFWAKVDKSADLFGCWLWTACMSSRGYGRFWDGSHAVDAQRRLKLAAKERAPW